MGRNQILGFLAFLGLVLVLSFGVIFPALQKHKEARRAQAPVSAKEVAAPVAEERAGQRPRSVLPRLKGVSWKSSPKKAPSDAETATTDADKKTPQEESLKKEAVPAPAVEAVSGTDAEEKDASGQEGVSAVPVAVIELISWNWFEQEGFAVVEGVVRNVSPSSIAGIRVVVRFEDENRALVASEYALLLYDPIFSGQESPFSVVLRFNPAMKEAVLDFRKFSGEEIPWKKARGR